MKNNQSVRLSASCYSKIFWAEASRLSSVEQSHYHVYGIFNYSEQPDISRLKMALQKLVDTHYNLRTTFVIDNEASLSQIINNHLIVELAFYTTNKKENFQLLFNNAIHQPFDLAKGPLFRFTLLVDPETKKTTFLPVFHHIILDGTQFDILMQTLSEYYRLLSKPASMLERGGESERRTHVGREDKSTDEPELKYLAQYLMKEKMVTANAHAQFWVDKLVQYPLHVRFPKQYHRTDKKDQEVHQLFVLSEMCYVNLKRFSIKNNHSIFNILKSVWAILISIYANQDKLVISFPINKRGKEYPQLKGAFVNTLFYFFERTGTFTEYLMQQKEETSAKKNWHVSRMDIVSALEKEHDFSVFFSQSDLFIHGPVLSTKPSPREHHFVGGIGSSKVCFFYQDKESLLYYGLAGLSDWVDVSLLQQMHQHFEIILSKVLTTPDTALKTLSCLSMEEYNTIAYSWSNINKPLFQQNKTICQLFEEQVEKIPDTIAIVSESISITYKTLNEKANQLAHYLRHTYTIQTEDLIAIGIERSEQWIIAMLGVLKAGAAYVPINLHHSEMHLRSILSTTEIKAVIIHTAQQDKLTFVLDRKKIFVWDFSGNQHQLRQQPITNPVSITHHQNLAYVMYTSGTTGTPKGVMVEHNGIVSLAKDSNCIPTNRDLAVMQLADVCFDAATFEIYVALLNGGKLYISKEISSLLSHPNHLKNYLIDNKINVLFLTKTLFDQLYLTSEDIFATIEYLLIGGEALNYSLVLKLSASKHKPTYLINGYGPTECTTFSTMYRITIDNIKNFSSVPIGKSVSGRTTYILDNYLNLLPTGAVGELYIGGVGLARGYLNASQLTAEKFITNPFDQKTRLYKTGDLARYLPDGNIEYIGRDDSQVKVRGYRVELSEIESHLTQYSGIKQAVVLLQDTNLIAYYVADNLIDENSILTYLASFLPNYMLPTWFIYLEKLPFNTNGKLDRDSLPQPTFKNFDEYVAPRTTIEQTLCEIYGEIFNLPANVISIKANFFRLGGNSILAMQLVYRLTRIFNISLSIAEIFHANTINQLAQIIQSNTKKILNISPAEKKLYYPLSFAQEQLSFIEKYESGTSAYHIPFIMKLNKEIVVKNLIRALHAIIERHEILRTVFIQDENGKHNQKIQCESLNIEMQFCKTENEYQAKIEKAIKRPFNLTREYPIRISLYEVSDDRYLFIILHHIASDGWSIEIFQKELVAYYEYYQHSIPLTLPALPIQYKDFAVWQREYISGEVLEEQLNYWRDRLNHHEILELPTDKFRPAILRYEAERLYFELPSDLSVQLRNFSKNHGYTLYTVLLAGFYVLLHQYSGQKDLVVGTPMASRNNESIQNLIGFFVTMLVQREQLDLLQPMSFLMHQIHQHLSEAHAHLDIPFEKLVQELDIKRDASRHPIFQVTFAVQSFGQHNKAFAQYFETVDTQHIQTMTTCDFGCLIDDGLPTLHGTMLYNSDLFEESTIKRWAEHYLYILKQIISKDKLLKDYRVLSTTDYQRIMYDWNNITPPKVDLIHILFEKQAEKTPDHIAVLDGNNQLTYRELNEKSNQLAHYLQKIAITLNTPIGIMMERSTHLIISVLAILKSGGVCVPLNTSEPAERLLHIIEDIPLSLVLVDSQKNPLEQKRRQKYLWRLLHFFKHRKIYPNTQATTFISLPDLHIHSELTSNTSLNHHAENLAFIVYTSGSTGTPKGVMLPHRVFSRCEYWAKHVFNLSCHDRFLFKSIRAPEELFFPLFIGATLIIAPSNSEKDAVLFIDTLIENNITVANFTPSFLEVLLEEISLKQLPHLKHVFCAGEILSIELQNKFFSYLSAKLYNFYGLAESPYTAYWQCKPPCNRGLQKLNDVVLIGKPVDTKVYILNSALEPVPIGAIGELCISGASLAKGYLNQTAYTQARFIQNPFEKNALLYKTGDLARYLPDGNIKHLGRNDFQVKVRGYRVELGEIEQYLRQYPGIKQAVALTKQNTLIAYYLADRQLNDTDILHSLSEYLPDYMLPSRLIFLEKFPLNTNGKLDRNALPKPELTIQHQYVRPRTKTEKLLCGVCAEIFSLPIHTISVNENFFHLGGNSILAIQFAHRVSRHLSIYLPVAEIFRTKTLQQLAKVIESTVTKNIIIRRSKKLTYYPLSFAQERLWFMEQYAEGIPAYHMPRLVKLSKNISLPALALALKTIVKRHTILRTVFFRNKSGQEYQAVQQTPLTIHIKHCSTWNEYQHFLKKDVNEPFNLRENYPIRVCIYQVTERNEQYLLINIHHIASDGWSTDLFQKELIMLYEHYHLGKLLKLPKLSIQYRDFAVWQRNFLSEKETKKQLDYWRNYLENYETLYLATDKPRPKTLSYEGASLTFSLNQALSTQLRDFSKTHGYTVYTVLLAGFYVLLHQYSGQEDILIGSPTANRHYDSIKNLIGFFVNMFALREQLNMNQPITLLMRQIQEHLSEAQRYQDISFERLVSALNIERDMSRHPLFQVIFVVQSFGKDEAYFTDYYQSVDIANLHNMTRYDLEFSMDDSSAAFQGRINYATALFNESTMCQWIEHYKNILVQIVNKPEQLLKNYRVLSDHEYQQIIYDWNQTHHFFPLDKTIQQLFEEQVARTPHHIALVFQDIQWTYQGLNQRANQLAHYLRETYAIKGDDLIALCLERSDLVIISILGVLKSGAAYVPIDAEYPEERINYILHDTQAKMVLDQSKYLQIENRLNHYPLYNPETITTSQHLAYVIYTSGTTGKPKGVMIEHRSVINTLFALNNIYRLNPGEKSAAFCHYVFDVSISEFFSPLLKGAELHLLSDKIRKDVALISTYIQSHGIHYLYLPPILLSTLPQLVYKNLKGIIYAGEPCDVAAGHYWSNKCRLFNYYGPTETTIYALGKQIINGDVHLIGKPIHNTTVYILNRHLNPVPIGAIGELYIGGMGLARGYLNQAELTAEKFIANPFQKDELLYKTGDLVRYWPDGNIEYIGRNDAQVKMRGYRIELTEIEQLLFEYPEIHQAVVLVQKHQQSSAYHYLVAYYVADAPLDEALILDYLSRHLPHYMMPTLFIFLEQLPLTLNGKLDKKALPIPEWKNEEAFIAPRSQTEKNICAIYAKMFNLPLDTIGIQANFFRLGGNSILAMQAVHALSEAFNIHLPIAEIFRTQTIEHLAETIESITIENIVIPPVEGLTHYPLSFAQERLWFIEQYEQGTSVYHMPRLTQLSQDVCLESLTKAIQAIVARHEVLRTIFLYDDEMEIDYQSVQQEPLNISLQTCKTFEEYQQQLKKDVNTPFDLRKEYPIRVCLYKMLEEDSCYLLVNMHHIASDGWSIDLFQKELVAYYEYYHLDIPLSLPPLSIQYKDFAIWQKNYLVEEKLKNQLDYWHLRLLDYVPLRLPTDKLRPSLLHYTGKTFFFYLTPELSAQLRAFAKKHHYSLYVVLLAGFYVLLHHCTNQKDIIIGTPSANRHYDSVKDLMGSFVNVLAQREQINLALNIFALMEQIHQHLIEVQSHQDIPFEKLIQELNIARDIRFHPLFQVMFSVQSFGQKEKNYSRYFHTIDITNIHPITRFDFACFVSTDQPVFKGLISYATHLFNESTMQHWLTHYISILTQMMNESDKPLNCYLPMRDMPQTYIENQYLPFTLKNEVMYVAPRNEWEKQLCHLFSEIFVLPVEAVGIHADFFQLGGTSIMAMRLAYKISRLIDKHFPIIEIFRARTIEKLAQSITSPTRFLEIEDFIVIFRKEGAQQPIFIIPGGAGEESELLLFVSIAMNLKRDCPVYGIRSKVSDPEWTLPLTLREQAEAVFHSIKKIQPHGPYYFFGECIAGALAVELQSIAEEKGEEKGVTFLLNSHPPYNKEFNLASPELPPKLEKYYRLLFSGKAVKLHSELHLLLSSDESAPDSLFESWQHMFNNKSYLHYIPGTHSTYMQDSPIIAAIIDEVLS